MRRAGYSIRWGLLSFVIVVAACERTPVMPTGVTAPPEYDRADWPQWIDEDGDCQDTRQEVLIQESLVAPTLDVRGCRVVAGRWQDEYTGIVYVDPAALEIDHRVPLVNAHRSGGWAWDRSRKRDYANYLVDPAHLVAVGAATNRSKGDRGPEAWRPPLRDRWCDYATAWRGIKQRWDLATSADEERALREMCP